MGVRLRFAAGLPSSTSHDPRCHFAPDHTLEQCAGRIAGHGLDALIHLTIGELMWAAEEVIAAANPAAMFFHMGPPMHLVPVTEGTDTQKRWTIRAFAEHRVGTMALTESEAEPEAGSDIGADRTEAIEQPDGTWHIEGVKRFASDGRGRVAGRSFVFPLPGPGQGPEEEREVGGTFGEAAHEVAVPLLSVG